MEKKRCTWAQTSNLKMVNYHDVEWGVPVYDDQKLFEMLILEGAQAGLSWETILNKREGYKDATHGFNAQYVADYGINLDELMLNTAIVRNRLKILSIEKNAKVFAAITHEYGTFAQYLWNFVAYTPIQNAWNRHTLIPAVSKEATSLSKDLKKRGCSFVGPTISYAFMQAVGMVNDHTTDCFRYQQIKNMGTTQIATCKD